MLSKCLPESAAPNSLGLKASYCLTMVKGDTVETPEPPPPPPGVLELLAPKVQPTTLNVFATPPIVQPKSWIVIAIVLTGATAWPIDEHNNNPAATAKCLRYI